MTADRWGASARLAVTMVACAAVLVPAAYAKPPKKGHGNNGHPCKTNGKAKGPTAAEIAAGEKVFAANGCAGCHTVNGKGGTSGPNLTTVAAEPKHTPKWLEVAVTNPKAHNPNAAMPAFGERIKGKDLHNLVAYLSTLKKAHKAS